MPTRSMRSAGGEVTETAEEVFAKAEMIVKVKEPLPEEYGLLRRGQILFTYLHLAANRAAHRGAARSRGDRHRATRRWR